MNKGFSFNTDSCLLAMNHLKNMMPSGIEFYSYYYSQNNKLMFACLKDEILDTFEIESDDEIKVVQELRDYKKVSYSWIMKSNLPLLEDYVINQSDQFNIFDEDKHLVLSLRINSNLDKNNDLICIVFQPELNVFGIETAKLDLNTDNKNLISNILYKSVTSVLTNGQNDKEKLEVLATKTKQVIEKGSVYKKRYNESRDDYHRNILNTAETFLLEYSEEMDKEFILSSESKDLLKKYSGNPLRLKEILVNAALFANNLNIGDNILIVIEEDYIDLTQSDIVTTEEATIKNKNTKTIYTEDLKISAQLDDYENALKKALADNLKPTGHNVAKKLVPKATPPAISQYLKKYQRIINVLLIKHPSRWSLMREHFRPLKNIIVEKKVPSKKTL